MRGYDGSAVGLIPLSVKQIFEYIGNDAQKTYKISVSYLEVNLPNLIFLDLQ